MIPVRYIQYGFGLYRLYYVVEGGGDLANPPVVHCYCAKCENDISKVIIELQHLDTGIYYFETEFKNQGNHLFVYYEGDQKTGILNAIVRPY